MKLQGFILEIGPLQSGVSQATGKEWSCRTLSLQVPYFTENGGVKFDNIAADYFGEVSDAELQQMVQEGTKLNFNVQFSTHKHNDRRYMSARVWNLAAVL